jgi:hypothetical protein
MGFKFLIALLVLVLLQGCAWKRPQISSVDFGSKADRILQESQKFRVRYRNSVGEGVGAWDPLPMASVSEVNCITWLNYVLSETFGSNPEEKQRVLARLKYFHGIVSFGTRKHFVDQWVSFDPGPLQHVRFAGCAQPQIQKVVLDPEGFARRVGYQCPLIYSEHKTFTNEYVDIQDFARCQNQLEDGVYVFFLIPQNWYLQKYGQRSGPMGLVHGEILRVMSTDSPQGLKRQFTVFNASLKSLRVESFPLSDLFRDGLKGFLGLALYRVHPQWDWKAEERRVHSGVDLTCERNLVKAGLQKQPEPLLPWEVKAELKGN